MLRRVRNTASNNRVKRYRYCLSGKNLKYKKEEPAGTKQNEDKQDSVMGASIRRSLPETSLLFVLILVYKNPCIFRC
jgi:hypothetical protein